MYIKFLIKCDLVYMKNKWVLVKYIKWLSVCVGGGMNILRNV